VLTIQGSRILVPMHLSKKVFEFYVQCLSYLSSRAIEMRVKALSNFIVKERSFVSVSVSIGFFFKGKSDCYVDNL